jgi:precorrin-6B methylase 2
MRGKSIFDILRSPAYARSLVALDQGGLSEIGWSGSRKNQFPQNQHGLCPWFTYSSIDFLDQVVAPHARVLEIGSGASTIWWALRGATVVSLESSVSWCERTLAVAKSRGVQSNIELIQVDSADQAISKISESSGKFDVVVNDGIEPRGELSFALWEKLDSSGLFVWDNSEREEYAPGIAALRSKGCWELNFYGIGPINTYAWQTSVFGSNPLKITGALQFSAGDSQ